jgi:hypothetical protein
MTMPNSFYEQEAQERIARGLKPRTRAEDAIMQDLKRRKKEQEK